MSALQLKRSASAIEVIRNQWRFIVFELERPALNSESIREQASNIQHRMAESVKPQTSSIKLPDNVGIIDVFAHDPKTDEIVLVMNEPRPWDSSEERLHQLQEKFNAYVSFLLDGELAEAHPDLASKPARIELRCAHMPDARAVELLGMIHDQLAFQNIKMEVIVRGSAL